MFITFIIRWDFVDPSLLTFVQYTAHIKLKCNLEERITMSFEVNSKNEDRNDTFEVKKKNMLTGSFHTECQSLSPSPPSFLEWLPNLNIRPTHTCIYKKIV